jgi:tetratricopeptide (TPR) repeat protein
MGERIRALRSTRGISQADLANALGISNSYLSHIEAGRRPVTAAMAAEIARALGVEPARLEGGVPPDNKEELQLRLRFAEMSLRNGEWELARQEFSDVLAAAHTLPLQPLADEAAWGKARAEEATGELERAIEGYEQLVARLDESSTVALAPVVVALIRAYSEAGDLNRAIDVGEQALARIGDGDAAADVSAEVELVSTVAGCYLERGDLTRAQLLINSALAKADQDGSPRARAAAAWNAAVVAESRHHVAAARVQADRALALYAEIDNARAVALLRVVSAGLRLREARPDPAAALPELDVAISELGEVGTQVDLGYAHTEQGRAYLLSGDAARAAELARQALIDLAGGDRVQRGRTLMVLGHAEATLGETEAALESYRQAADDLRTAGAPRQAASAWRELGEAYIALGRTEEALDALRNATDLAGATYNPVRAALDATPGHSLR